jgi:hypothetical protein
MFVPRRSIKKLILNPKSPGKDFLVLHLSILFQLMPSTNYGKFKMNCQETGLTSVLFLVHRWQWKPRRIELGNITQSLSKLLELDVESIPR